MRFFRFIKIIQIIDNIDFHLLRDFKEDVFHKKEMKVNQASAVTPLERKLLELQAANTYQKVVGDNAEFNWFYF